MAGHPRRPAGPGYDGERDEAAQDETVTMCAQASSAKSLSGEALEERPGLGDSGTTLAAPWLRGVIMKPLYGRSLSSRYRGIPLHELSGRGSPALGGRAMAAAR